MKERRGILLIDKPAGSTSFHLVALTRRLLGVQKVGHAGTLDPLATGVMVLLVGREYTRLAQTLIQDDKEYTATLHLGMGTDTDDSEGKVTATSEDLPTLGAIEEQLIEFQGWQEQVPPMFSAKKIKGKKLYELARKGIEVERRPEKVYMSIQLLSYDPPYLSLHITCSKGTYIRSLARDLGAVLGCYGHLSALRRCRSGRFKSEECLSGALLCQKELSAEEVASRLLTAI